MPRGLSVAGRFPAWPRHSHLQTRKDSISKRVLDDFTADRRFDRDNFYFNVEDLQNATAPDHQQGEQLQRSASGASPVIKVKRKPNSGGSVASSVSSSSSSSGGGGDGNGGGGGSGGSGGSGADGSGGTGSSSSDGYPAARPPTGEGVPAEEEVAASADNKRFVAACG
jgi:hypothetical protein